MKVFRAFVLITAMASASQVVLAADPKLTTIRAIKLTKPCHAMASVKLTSAYLYAMRHPAWITQGRDIGANDGLPLQISSSLSRAKNKTLFNYLYRNHESKNSMLNATFVGSISCNASGAPTLVVERVDSIQLIPIVPID